MARQEKLLEFLGSRRWFGDKGRTIHSATLKDMIPITWPGVTKEYAVARAEVVTDAGVSTYQLFLVQPPPTREGELYDALEEDEFRRLLADAFAKGVRFESGGAGWIVESEGKQPVVVPPGAPITLATGEQSNSSVILNRQAILKLYRKLERGVHPDVEVTRFLTVDRAFVHTPTLLGTIRFEDPGGATVAGMMQEYVQGATDGWRYALDCSRAYFDAKASMDPTPPFQAEAEQLGVVTRALHEALSSGDEGSEFDLRGATASDVKRWVAAASRTIEEALLALERAIAAKTVSGAHLDEARVVAQGGPRYAAWVNDLADSIESDAGANTRTHGDYHLGQVIRSAAARFLIIDFEGEPARPLAERRARHSPLRDVAGMLRSFAYAAAEGSKDADPRVLDTRAARWEKNARDAFLRGYFAEPENGTGRGRPDALLPRSRNNVGRLLSLFEAEKIFYEVHYELDHRPDWVWIPLRGVARLFA